MTIPLTVIKRRLVLLLLFSLIFSITLIGRLFWLQFVRGDELKQRAHDQWTKDVMVEPVRGTLYDRNANPLAVSATVDTVVASVPDIGDIEKTAEMLAPALDMDKAKLVKLL
jgi:stage V sporulation protein D (sporulation-specific penicillin-binding protein)